MKYYRTISDGHIQLWKTLKDIPKGHRYDEMDIPGDKDGLHSLVQELLDQLWTTEQLISPKIEVQNETQEEKPIEEIQRLGQEFDKPTNYTDWSVEIDASWDRLGLARKLDFAAMALTEARQLYVSEGVAERNNREGGRGLPGELSKD